MDVGERTGANAFGSAEFALAVECCRRAFPNSTATAIDLRSVNWDAFLRLVRFHRIEGLAWNGLAAIAEVPATVAEALKVAASTIAAENLRAKAECVRLLNRFEAATVPLLFLKGLTLGALAYRNPAIKSAVDIDLLIAPEQLPQAAEVLRERGYELHFPRGVGLVELRRKWKESDWLRHGSPSFQIDLHTRTADNPLLIPTITAHSPRRLVDIGDGISLPTLAEDETFAYLAVHGASSAWFRLKWISDFAALISAKPPAEIQQLYRRSQELRCGRAAAQALLLADTLFGSLEQLPELRQELAGDSRTRLLFRTALRQLTRDPIEPTERRMGTLAIHWTQFLLLPGLAYKRKELAGQAARIMSRF